MIRPDNRRGVLLILAVFVFLFGSTHRLDAFPPQLLFVNVNGQGRLEDVGLFSEGTAKSIAIHLNRSEVSQFHFDAKTLAFGWVLAGNFDHDGDLDLIWLSGGGPSSAVVLQGDGQGNFEFVANSHFHASELLAPIGRQWNARWEPERSSLFACLSSSFDHSKDLAFAAAGYVADCEFRSFLVEGVGHSLRAPPQSRYSSRSPPQQSFLNASFSS